MIDCVSVPNNHLFTGNPIAEQHRLRFREIIEQLKWNVPHYNDMEFDQYDTPATQYLLWRNKQREVAAMCRIHPSNTGCMISDHFNFLVQNKNLPKGKDIYEGTRMVADRSLSKEERQQAIQEIVVGFIEYGVSNNLSGYIGIMPPKVWESTFMRAGWEMDWLGPVVELPNGGGPVRAAFYEVSTKTENAIRDKTKIHHSILNFGQSTKTPLKFAKR